MDELFSCRNCVHNPSQSLNTGRGAGYCLLHHSVVREPEQTTCKHLYRKDMPAFVVDEGVKEHAAEFVHAASLASLVTGKPLGRVPYSEKHDWEHRVYDDVRQAVTLYGRGGPSWVSISSFSGGMDGRRSLAHAALVRRYQRNCGTWTSVVRLALGALQELASKPIFNEVGVREERDSEDALWDVVFVRLSCIQEYGWDAGIEPLMWATDQLNGALTEFDWTKLEGELRTASVRWTDQVIAHAKAEGAFFPPPETEESVSEVDAG